MRNMLKGIKNWLKEIYWRIALGKWVWIVHPGSVEPQTKYEALLYFQDKFKIKNLVETGTFLGDAVEFCRTKFEKIYSIELGHSLYREAKHRFKNYNHIEILQGDSGLILPELLPKIQGSVLFWLDGHYSRGITAKGELNTPVLAEVKSILNSGRKNFCILIDDANLFTGLHDYPRINALEKLAKNHDLAFEVQNNIIRIYPALSDLKFPAA